MTNTKRVQYRYTTTFGCRCYDRAETVEKAILNLRKNRKADRTITGMEYSIDNGQTWLRL